MSRPNIVYIHSHDTGRYIQPYGYAVPTPNLQRLAEGGVLFRQAFNGGPTCSPSRACLLTGMCQHRNGMVGLAHRGFRLNDYRQHLVHTLKAAGYLTALSGAQHEAAATPERAAWQTIGYDCCLGNAPDGHAHAVAFLEDAPAQPFFLAVGFQETHRAFPEPGPEDDPDYVRPPDPIPDTPETRRDMAGFITSARSLDAKMGAVFDALDRTGLADNTLVVCTTDHGVAFPRMKCNLTDGGIGVMLIVRGPGGFEGGRVVDGLVSHLDVFPTLCDLLALEQPDWLEGHSLLPLVRGETESVRDAVFSEVNYHAAYEPMRCVRTERWKYIRRYDGRSRPVLANVDDGPGKKVWMQAGWADQAPPEEALYDLVFDPQESNNLAGSEAHAQVQGELRARLERWMRDTDDPLLTGGVVPAPPGAIVNDPDSLSPRDRTRPAQG